MKKRLISLFILLLSFILVSCKTVEEKNIVPLPEKEVITENVNQLPKDSIKILAIGNSFSDDAMVNYMYGILKAFGVNEIILGNMYIGGCTVETHYYNAINDSPNYIYRKNDSTSDNPGVFVNTANMKLSDALKDENWDLITLQQASHDSGMVSTYKLDQINYIFDLALKTTKNYKIQFAWHMTWAYHKNTGHSAFPKYNNDQMTMYEAICGCVNQNIINNDYVNFVIPAGTAIQNARTSYLGDNLTEGDGYHLNTLGDYIAGLTWILKYTGWDINDLNMDLVPSQFVRDIEVIKESCVNAIKNPYSVTESIYQVKPELNIDLSKYELLDWQPTFGHWNSTGGAEATKIITSMKNFVCSGKRFTKEELPVGSIIIIEQGWQYRPDGWNLEDANTTGTRPGNVTTELVVIDEAWWGDYILRGFNVSSSSQPDLSNMVSEVGTKLKIYVPKA